MALTVREYRELIKNRDSISDDEANLLIDLYQRSGQIPATDRPTRSWTVRFDRNDMVSILGADHVLHPQELLNGLIYSEYFDKYEYLDWLIVDYQYTMQRKEFIITLEYG